MHFDWTINISAVCSALAILGAIVHYGGKVVNFLRDLSFRVDIMWAEFAVEHPELVKLLEAKRNRDH